MAKQVKSVRFEPQLLNLFYDYSNLLKEMHGMTLPFGLIVNTALAKYIAELVDNTFRAMGKEKIFWERLPSGMWKEHKVTEDQFSKLQEFQNLAEGLAGFLESSMDDGE